MSQIHLTLWRSSTVRASSSSSSSVFVSVKIILVHGQQVREWIMAIRRGICFWVSFRSALRMSFTFICAFTFLNSCQGWFWGECTLSVNREKFESYWIVIINRWLISFLSISLSFCLRSWLIMLALELSCFFVYDLCVVRYSVILLGTCLLGQARYQGMFLLISRDVPLLINESSAQCVMDCSLNFS